MKLIRVVALVVVFFGSIWAEEADAVIPKSKLIFEVVKGNSKKIVDLSGKNFIVVSLREKGADGASYAIDSDGVLWWASPISSGAKGHETPSGIYKVLRKERYYMSKAHPDPSGVNNMDFSLFFTNRGHAIHMGNTNAMSHGCIHMGEKGARSMFKWANHNTRVVITREHYLPFVYNDLLKAGYRLNKKTPKHIREYLKRMKPIEPHMDKNLF